MLKHVEFGIYLDGEDAGEILLPSRDLPEKCDIGDSLEVFVYYDSEDRLIATTVTPTITVGEVAVLKVVALEDVGAFLDWGLDKDLLLPFAEQTRRPQLGQEVIVIAYLDKSLRISASMRTEKRMEKAPVDYRIGQAVELLIAEKTDLGFNAIIDGKHWGLLFENEVFQELHYGQSVQGFIKLLRADGKIDLSLAQAGHQGAEGIGPLILEMLAEQSGFLAISDKTSAEEIHRLFGVSKKKFKIALGGLYKQRLITVSADGIRLA